MRSTLLAATAILTLPFGCRTLETASYELTETMARNYEDDLGMRPGVGFDAVLEDVRGECIDFDGLEARGSGQETVYSIQLIESHRDLLSQLNVSPASQIKAATEDQNFQTSRKTKFALGTDFGISRYSVYLLVSARVLNTTEFLKNYRLKPAVLEGLGEGNDEAIKRFRAQCGDSFMVGSTSGGEFYALLEIATNSDQLNATLKDQLRQATRSNSTGQMTSSSDLEGSLKNMVGGRNMRVWIYQRGGSGQQQAGVVTTVDDVMVRLKSLAESVKQGENPRPISATFSDYLTLGMSLPQSYLEKVEEAQEVIKQLADTLARLMDLRSDIDHILTRTEAFIGVGGQKLVEMRDVKRKIDEQIRKIHEVGMKCGRNFADCRVPRDLSVPHIELPSRKPTLEQLSSERLRIKTKLHYLNRSGISDFWSEPECYVEVRVGSSQSRDYTPVYKSETTYTSPRCANLQTEIDLSVTVIKDVYKEMQIPLQSGLVKVLLWEDDLDFDDLIGETQVSFSSLMNGAQLKGINNDNINIEVGFELEY